MILGLLSDSHGRVRRVAHAIKMLEHLGAEAFVHCGDLGESVLEEFVGRKLWFVWGNTDPQGASAVRFAQSLGFDPPLQIPTQFTVDGRRIAVFHGHEAPFERLLQMRRNGDYEGIAQRIVDYDVLLYGHTHTAWDDRIAKTRIINPGALERARFYTVATLDVARNDLRFWQVDEGMAPDADPRPYTLGQ